MSDQETLSQFIEKSTKGGKYVQIVNNMIELSISIIPVRNTFSFDAKVCSLVPTWTKKMCRDDISGEICFIAFPSNYMPDLVLDGVKFEYYPPYNDTIYGMLVISDTKDLYDSYRWYQEHQYDLATPTKIRSIFKWSSSHSEWNHTGSYRDTDISTIVGLESIYRSILKDIDLIQNRKDLLDKLGMIPSLNYCLYSRPGMGKTSLIRCVCTHLNAPIHLITHNALKSHSPEKVFSMSKGNALSVYVFEDFDRYLDTAGEEQMASLLNALDGVENMPSSIRFFTSNTVITGKKMEAFLSRMRRNISLPSHGSEAYMRSINIVFPEMEQEGKNKILEYFHRLQYTMRVANQILCASMISDNPIQSILHSEKPS